MCAHANRSTRTVREGIRYARGASARTRMVVLDHSEGEWCSGALRSSPCTITPCDPQAGVAGVRMFCEVCSPARWSPEKPTGLVHGPQGRPCTIPARYGTRAPWREQTLQTGATEPRVRSSVACSSCQCHVCNYSTGVTLVTSQGHTGHAHGPQICDVGAALRRAVPRAPLLLLQLSAYRDRYFTQDSPIRRGTSECHRDSVSVE